MELRLTGSLITTYESAGRLLVIAEGITRGEWAEEKLRKDRDELRRALMMAECRERERLACVLTNGLQQTLASMKFQLTAMERETEFCGSAAGGNLQAHR